MVDNVFEILVDNHSYRMVLPHWETDYIQGMLADIHQPYELEMLRAMASILKPGELVLDVGANIGNHSMYLAVVAGCKVLAFEPNPELCRPFIESISLNDLNGKIFVHQNGVGSATAKAHFASYTPENLGGQSLAVDDSKSSTISVIPLDSLKIEEKVRAIKVDVEGMEAAVLNGAQQLILRDKPYLFVEAQTESDFELLHDMVVKFGYVYWDTFNATPTHWFICKDELGEEAIFDHYFKKALDSYKLRLERRNVQQKLDEANKKYRSANERIAELKENLDLANNRYKEITGQAKKNMDKLKAEIAYLQEKLARYEGMKLTMSASEVHEGPERALGLDFSLPEDMGQG